MLPPRIDTEQIDLPETAERSTPVAPSAGTEAFRAGTPINPAGADAFPSAGTPINPAGADAFPAAGTPINPAGTEAFTAGTPVASPTAGAAEFPIDPEQQLLDDLIDAVDNNKPERVREIINSTKNIDDIMTQGVKALEERCSLLEWAIIKNHSELFDDILKILNESEDQKQKGPNTRTKRKIINIHYKRRLSCYFH